MPVARGIAVVDPVARTVRRKVTLPVTPSDAWVAPATGRLFATLPGADRVAVLDTGVPGAVPRLVNAPGQPVAVAGTRPPPLLWSSSGWTAP